MFVDVDTGLLGSGYGGFATGYTLRGTDTSASQFISTCSGEGGHACAQKNGSLTPVSPCPTYSFTIPQNAPNASGGGNCYSTTLVCSPNNNIDKASLCKGNVTLTP
jgi:hypothetical protein